MFEIYGVIMKRKPVRIHILIVNVVKRTLVFSSLVQMEALSADPIMFERGLK